MDAVRKVFGRRQTCAWSGATVTSGPRSSDVRRDSKWMQPVIGNARDAGREFGVDKRPTLTSRSGWRPGHILHTARRSAAGTYLSAKIEEIVQNERAGGLACTLTTWSSSRESHRWTGDQ